MEQIPSCAFTSAQHFKHIKSISPRGTAAFYQTGTEGWLQHQGEHILSETNPSLFINICAAGAG
jgi:hypothetical protein